MIFFWTNPKYRVVALWMSAFVLGLLVGEVLFLPLKPVQEPVQSWEWWERWERAVELAIIAPINVVLLLSALRSPPQAFGGGPTRSAEPGSTAGQAASK